MNSVFNSFAQSIGDTNLTITLWVIFFVFCFAVGFVVLLVYLMYNERALVIDDNNRIRKYMLRRIVTRDGVIIRKTFLAHKEVPDLRTTDDSFLQGRSKTYLIYENKIGDWHYIRKPAFSLGGNLEIDPSVRRLAANLRIEKEREHDTKGFWSQYGTIVTGVGAIVIIMMFGYLYLQEYTSFTSAGMNMIQEMNSNTCIAQVDKLINMIPDICQESITQKLDSFPVT